MNKGAIPALPLSGFLLRAFCCWMTLLAGGLNARAATYYINPQGADSNSGTDIQRPWRTVARVNVAHFSPGDRVLFARGGLWRESLRVSSSGTREQPIVFADYNAGAKPQFVGSDVLPELGFSAVGEGVFACPVALPVGAVVRDGQFLLDAPKADADWFEWKDGLLKLHLHGRDPRFNGGRYSACVREDALGSNGQSHLIFRNLCSDETARADGGYGFRIQNSEDVRVENCEARRAGKHHFACINSTGVVLQGCLAASSMPHQGHGGSSAFVSFGDDPKMGRQFSRYENCVFKDTSDPWDGEQNAYVFVCHGAALGRVELQNMVSYGAPWSLDNSESGAALTIRGGLLDNNRLELYGRGLLVDGLKITGARASVDISASHCTLQDVLVSGTNLGTSWFQTAILSRGDNNAILFCRVELAPEAPDFNTPLALADAGRALLYSHNLFKCRGAEFKNWTKLPDDQAVAQTLDNVRLKP